MNEFDEENINPELWTQKELLKHVYREVISLKQQMSKMEEVVSDVKSIYELRGKVDDITHKVEDLERKSLEYVARNKTLVNVWGVTITVIGVGLAIIKLFM